MISVKILITTLLVLPLMAWAGGSSFDVRNYGAIGDGTKLDTAALQQAIDTAANAGGGTVNFPSGRYLSGSLELKSHVTLELEAGAILLGSPRLSDYHHGDYRGLLWADRQQDFTVSGPGVIDGQGGELVAGTEAGDRPSHAKAGPRPMVINFHNCTHITVQDITLQDSASWVEDYRDCDHLTLKHITVRSMAALNNDGMDIDGCQQVVVRGCDIDSEDDGICLKSKDRTCADVLVENCRVRSSCNALKCGTESAGGFKNITCRNLEIYDTYISAIALETVDGAKWRTSGYPRLRLLARTMPFSSVWAIAMSTARSGPFTE
jgi:polygalacturonase